ncbi:MAG TPA: acyl-CoA dehydrogenase [Mycobacteriales bacterium]
MTDTVPAPATGEAPGPALTATLRALLDGDQAPTKDRLRRILSGPEFAYPDPEIDRAAYRELVFERAKLLAGHGVGSRRAEDAAAGDSTIAERIAAFTVIGLGDLSLMVKVGVQFGLFGGAIQRLGTARHHAAYLDRVASIDLPGCFAMSELGHGSDVRNLRTEARYDPETREFVITTPDENARKDWIGNAGLHGRAAVVFAQLQTRGEGHGVHAFVVPIRNEDGTPRIGVEITDCGAKMGLNGVDNGRLRFHDVRVPREALLDRYGSVAEDGTYSSPIESPSRRFFTMIGALVEGRIAVAAQAMSVTQVGLVIAVRYALRRRQFPGDDGRDQLLMDYTTHQRRLLPALATTYGLVFAHRELVSRYAHVLAEPDDIDQRSVEALAAGTKAYATWHNTETLGAARQCCGGKGYLAENRFVTLMNDSDVFTTFEGDNTVLTQLVVKDLISDHVADFEDLDLVGMLRTVAGWIGERLAPTHAPGDWTSPDGLTAAFAWREQHLVETLGRRLKALVDDGVEPAEALNLCMDHGGALFRASMEHTILRAFPAAAPWLVQQLRSLFALSRIERDRAYFLEHGYLSTEQGASVAGLVDELCREVRPYAGTLVDAFGIPDELVAAPIATG